MHSKNSMVWTCFKKGWWWLGENVLLWRLREPDRGGPTNTGWWWWLGENVLLWRLREPDKEVGQPIQDDDDGWVKMCYYGGWGSQTEVGQPIHGKICTSNRLMLWIVVN